MRQGRYCLCMRVACCTRTAWSCSVLCPIDLAQDRWGPVGATLVVGAVGQGGARGPRLHLVPDCLWRTYTGYTLYHTVTAASPPRQRSPCATYTPQEEATAGTNRCTGPSITGRST